MSNFVYDNVSLNGAKVNRGPLPGGEDPNKWIQADQDWNPTIAALYDLRGAVISNAFLGLVRQTIPSIPVSGANDFLWADASGNLYWHKNGTGDQQLNGGGGGSIGGTVSASFVPYASGANTLANSAMTWDSTNGALGIGTTTPYKDGGGNDIDGSRMHIFRSSGSAMFVAETATGSGVDAGILFYTPTNVEDAAIFLDESDARKMKFAMGAVNVDGDRNASTKMVLLQTGRLGIGTTAPVSQLDVNGNVSIGTYAGTAAAPGNGLIVSGFVGVGCTSASGAGNLEVRNSNGNAVGGQFVMRNMNSAGQGEFDVLDHTGQFRLSMGFDNSSTGGNPDAYYYTGPSTDFIFQTNNGAHLAAQRADGGWTFNFASHSGSGNTVATQHLMSLYKDITWPGDTISSQLAIVGTTDPFKILVIGEDTSTTHGYGFIAAGHQAVQWTFLALQPSGGSVAIGSTAPGTTLDIADGLGGNAAAMAFRAGQSAAVSAANTGRIRYNTGTQIFEQSLNGAAYVPLGSGATSTLAATYAAGSTSADQTLTISGADGDHPIFSVAAVGTAQTPGLALANPTAATAGNQKYSPLLELSGFGWKTDATAASQSVKWGVQNRPVQSAANPTSMLDFMSNINGAGYTQKVSIGSDGSIYGSNDIYIYPVFLGSSYMALYGTGAAVLSAGANAIITAVGGVQAQNPAAYTGVPIFVVQTFDVAWSGANVMMRIENDGDQLFEFNASAEQYFYNPGTSDAGGVRYNGTIMQLSDDNGATWYAPLSIPLSQDLTFTGSYAIYPLDSAGEDDNGFDLEIHAGNVPSSESGTGNGGTLSFLAGNGGPNGFSGQMTFRVDGGDFNNGSFASDYSFGASTSDAAGAKIGLRHSVTVIHANSIMASWEGTNGSPTGTAKIGRRGEFSMFTAGISTGQDYGLRLQNSNTASSGNQKYSPAVEMLGRGWKTAATAASQEVGWLQQVRPTQGVTNPGAELVFWQSINGAAYAEMFKFDTDGNLIFMAPSAGLRNLRVSDGAIVAMTLVKQSTTTDGRVVQFVAGDDPGLITGIAIDAAGGSGETIRITEVNGQWAQCLTDGTTTITRGDIVEPSPTSNGRIRKGTTQGIFVALKSVAATVDLVVDVV